VKALAAVLVLAIGGAACGGDEPTAATTGEPALTTAGGGGCARGIHDLTLPNGQAAQLQVGPEDEDGAFALVVALHGAGGTAAGALEAFRAGWDEPGLALVAPQAKASTWSVLQSGVDEDLESVNQALAAAYERCRIDRTRVAVGGFSDGATYALTLAVANGDLFSAAIAFSPGGVLAEEQRGRPRIFVSHGTHDSVLPIATTGDAVAEHMREAGYAVTYRRFHGDHEVSEETSRIAIRWLVGDTP
jgi:phospholipase/carboxylesterase